MKESIEITAGECRFCSATLKHKFIDVFLPVTVDTTENHPSDEKGDFQKVSTFVCSECFLIQKATVSTSTLPEQFHLSAFSSGWLTEMKDYMDQVFEKFEITGNTLVTELVDHSESSKGGIRGKNQFFGSSGSYSLADFYGKADQLDGHTELANVSDINDFFSGIKSFLSLNGIVTLEFRHLLPILEANQSDISFAGHFPYFSFTTVDKMVKKHGLEIVDVEECNPTGSLRIYAKHHENLSRKISTRVLFLRGRERDRGMSSSNFYS